MVLRSNYAIWTVFAQARSSSPQAIWQLRSSEDNVTQAKMTLEQVCSLEYFRPSEIIKKIVVFYFDCLII